MKDKKWAKLITCIEQLMPPPKSYMKNYPIFFYVWLYKTINNSSNPLRIHISNYSTGLYLLKEKSEKTIETSTFLKLISI